MAEEGNTKKQQEIYEETVAKFVVHDLIGGFPMQWSLISAQSRRAVGARPLDPTLDTLTTFVIPEQFLNSLNPGNPTPFVLHRESELINGRIEGFIAMGCQYKVSILPKSKNIATDATFATVPRLLYQLYNINFFLTIRSGRKLFTGLYFLMTGKSQRLYTKILQWIVGYAGGLPDPIDIKWERTMVAIPNAFHTVLATVEVDGCFFHQKQAMILWAFEHNLKDVYESDGAFFTFFGLIGALTSCLSEEFQKVFNI